MSETRGAGQAVIHVHRGGKLVALVGNPNCGKTALFNLLTGSRQKVANYAGVTVERKGVPGPTTAQRARATPKGRGRGSEGEGSLPPRDEAWERQRRTGAAETDGHNGDERRGDGFGGDPWTKARRGRHEA